MIANDPDPVDVERLAKFMDEEAGKATDERQSWFEATAKHLRALSAEVSELRAALKDAEVHWYNEGKRVGKRSVALSGRRAPIEEVGEDGFPPAQIAPPPPDNCDDSPPRSIIGKQYGNDYEHVFVKSKRAGIYACCCGVRRKKKKSISRASSDDLTPFVYQKWNTRKWSDAEPPCTGPRINEHRVDGRE